MSIDVLVYVSFFVFLLILYVTPMFRGPFKNNALHVIGDKVKVASFKHYEDVISAHPNFDDNECLEKYARLTEKCTQAFLMYQESGDKEDIKDVERHADYWMRWTKYLNKKTKSLENKYSFQVVPLNPDHYFDK